MNIVKDLDKVFVDYCENSTDLASQSVRNALKEYHIALDNYINAVFEDSWKNGFNHAVHLMNVGAPTPEPGGGLSKQTNAGRRSGK